MNQGKYEEIMGSQGSYGLERVYPLKKFNIPALHPKENKSTEQEDVGNVGPQGSYNPEGIDPLIFFNRPPPLPIENNPIDPQVEERRRRAHWAATAWKGENPWIFLIT